MLDITERIKTSLKNSNTHLWFPHLTHELVEIGWQALEQRIGVTSLDYGTTRVLVGNANAPRNVVTSLSTHIEARGSRATVPIEVLPKDIARQYEIVDVSFYTAEEITNTKVLNCLEDALSILKQVPTLLTTVTSLVRSLHVIKPKSEEYDVSFSDPDIPFSIFVSVPEECKPNNHLCIAEAIVHEPCIFNSRL